MTDIVERLRKTASRGVSVWGDLQMEAADVIDTLRARLAQREAEPWKPDWAAFVEYWAHESHLQTYADRERFRAAVKAMTATPPAQPAPAPVVPAWISVADRMPEKGVPVLALDSIGKYPIRACWIAKFTQEAGCDFEGDADYCEANDEHYWPEGWYEWNRHEDTHWFAPSITHWMPLPAAPGSAPAVPAVREPLHQAQLFNAYCNTLGIYQFVQAFVAGARYAEAHHGIGTQGGEK